jgi:hypothetical protein
VPPGVPLSGERNEAIDRWRCASGTLEGLHLAAFVTEVTVRRTLTIVERPLRGWVLDRTREQIAALELFIRSGGQPADAQALTAAAAAEVLGDELAAASMAVESEDAGEFVDGVKPRYDRDCALAIRVSGHHTMTLFVDAARWQYRSEEDAAARIRLVTLALSRTLAGWRHTARELLMDMGQPDRPRPLEPLARHAAAESKGRQRDGRQALDPASPNWALLAPGPWIPEEIPNWHAHANCWDSEPISNQVRARDGGRLVVRVTRILEWAAIRRLRTSGTAPEIPKEVLGRRRPTERADEQTVAIEVSSLLGGFPGCAHEKLIGNLPVSCVAVNESALMARMFVRHASEELSPIESSALERLMPVSEPGDSHPSGAARAVANLGCYGIARRRIRPHGKGVEDEPCSSESGEHCMPQGFGGCARPVLPDGPRGGPLALLASARPSRSATASRV